MLKGALGHWINKWKHTGCHVCQFTEHSGLPCKLHIVQSRLLLTLQRRFLIQLETQFEPVQEGRGTKAWAEGRWGYPFVALEKEFTIYGPYCANYLSAITVVNEQMPFLLVGHFAWCKQSAEPRRKRKSCQTAKSLAYIPRESFRLS
jgi:hypothetical protein